MAGILRAMFERRRARLEKNPGGAVYGSIVVTASIAAMSHHENRAWVVLVEAATTLGVFWLAHVHSAIVDHQFESPNHRLREILPDAVAEELPMLEVAIVPFAILLASAGSFLDEARAVAVALWVGVAQLFIMGYRRARRSDRGALRSILVGLVYAASGGVLVLLKATLH